MYHNRKLKKINVVCTDISMYKMLPVQLMVLYAYFIVIWITIAKGKQLATKDRPTNN